MQGIQSHSYFRQDTFHLSSLSAHSGSGHQISNSYLYYRDPRECVLLAVSTLPCILP